MSWDELVRQLTELISNPGSDPRRLAIVAAFVFLLLMTAVVAILLFLPDSDQEEEEAEDGEERRTTPGPKKRSLAGLLMTGGIAIMLIVIAAAVIGADRFARDTRICAQCHYSAAVSESWAASTHASVGCMSCHGGPGLTGALDLRLRGMQNGLSTLLSSSPAAPVVVDYEACSSCHARELSGTRTSNHLRVRHSDFADEVPCKQCHGRVGHQPEGVRRGALTRGVMSSCADCHDGQTASSECSTCHERDFALASMDSGGFAKVDLPAPTTCRGCHELTRCTACHGIEMPHPANWKDPKQHAPAGAFDQTVCSRCHDRTCSECHRAIHDNHGPEWKVAHQENPDGTWCTLRCHDKTKVGENMCALCHEGR